MSFKKKSENKEQNLKLLRIFWIT